MTAPAPHSTPNQATSTRPERSSRRVARKGPLGWLPWALLGLLAALLALTFLLVNAVDDDGADGPSGDSLGQIGGDEDGGSGEGAGSGSASGAGAGSSSGSGSGSAGGGAVDLAALSAGALIGGGAVPAAAASETQGAQPLTQAPGAAGAVLFAEGSADIDANGQQVITQVSQALRDAGATSVQVVGHTDRIAGDPVNDTLSQKRADNVAAALEKEVPGLQTTTDAKAADEPIADNGSEQGRQLNRRAVITAQG